MLIEKYSKEFLTSSFIPRKEWSPFPAADDREKWNALLEKPLNRERMRHITGMALGMARQPWPALPATLFMEFERNGNRSRFEGPYMERRSRLSTFVLAECFQHRNVFIDEIINGLWLLMEETTWALSAHAYRPEFNGSQDPLPDTKQETLALFSLQTAMLLADTWHLLHNRLEAVSPVLLKRLRSQLMTRVIENFEKNTSESDPEKEIRCFQWMDGHNNWTTWCCSSLLATAMILIDDPERLAQFTRILMRGIDRFIDQYGADGGCDEGPGYWNHAAGKMVFFLDLLHSRTNGAVDIFNEPKIREMGMYIHRAHLGNNWFANFADAPARTRANRLLTWRYAERINSDHLRALVQYQHTTSSGEYTSLFGTSKLGDMIREMFELPEKFSGSPLKLEKEIWLPDLQLMVSRDREDSVEGLTCAAKAGHNSESHNHNDIGQFILMAGGEPVIVDSGSKAYTRVTFSKARYRLMEQRSLGHNVPIVNQIEQRSGEEYRAGNVIFTSEPHRRSLSMDLKDAYPDRAEITSLTREIIHTFDPRSSVEIRDTLDSTRKRCSLTVHLLSTSEPVEAEAGVWLLNAENNCPIRLEFDPFVMSCVVDYRQYDDRNLKNIWNGGLYTIDLGQSSDTGSMTMAFRFLRDE